MTFEEIRDYLAKHNIEVAEENYSLSEKFQGTIGREFWFEASCIDPEGFEHDLMLVSVERDKAGQHIHIEPHKGYIQETLSWDPEPREFERILAIMTLRDWMELMMRQMKDSYDDGI